MRKFITYILLLAMVFSLFGCRGQDDGTTAPTVSLAPESAYTVKDVLVSQAVRFAGQLGAAIGENYLQKSGIPDEIAKNAKVFYAAAKQENVLSAAFLPMEKVDLPQALTMINNTANSSAQSTCVNALQFTTQFYCDKELPTDTGVYLRFAEQCHIVVVFEAEANQLITATVYPLFANAANTLLHKYYSNANTLNRNMVVSACKRTAAASFQAKPTGRNTTAAYYLAMGQAIFENTSPLSKEDISKYTSESIVGGQVALYSKALSGDSVGGIVYRFPAAMESKVTGYTSIEAQDYARQQMYFGFADSFCSSYDQLCVSANAVLKKALQTSAPGAVATETEAPVLIALDFGACTALVTIYPSENNTYLFSVTCLPGAFTQVTALLTQNGCTVMN